MIIFCRFVKFCILQAFRLENGHYILIALSLNILEKFNFENPLRNVYGKFIILNFNISMSVVHHLLMSNNNFRSILWFYIGGRTYFKLILFDV